MHNILLLAAREWMDMAFVVIVIVVGVIRFVAGFLKKPNVPPGGGPPQPGIPKTPEVLQQEIERFIRQAQGREPKMQPPPPPERRVAVERKRPDPPRKRQPMATDERGENKPRPQNQPRSQKSPRVEEQPLPAVPLSKRHRIQDEVRNLGQASFARRNEHENGGQGVAPSMEQRMHSVFEHKVGSLDTDMDTQSATSAVTHSTKQTVRPRISKAQIRQGIILNEILTRPNFD